MMSNDPNPSSDNQNDVMPESTEAEAQETADQQLDEPTPDGSHESGEELSNEGGVPEESAPESLLLEDSYRDEPMFVPEEPTTEVPDEAPSETDFAMEMADEADASDEFPRAVEDEAGVEEALDAALEALAGPDGGSELDGDTGPDGVTEPEMTVDETVADDEDVTNTSAERTEDTEDISEEVVTAVAGIAHHVTESLDGFADEVSEAIAPDAETGNLNEGDTDDAPEAEDEVISQHEDAVEANQELETTLTSSPETPTPEETAPSMAPATSTSQTSGGTTSALRSGVVWTLQTSVRGLDWVSDKLAFTKPKAETESEHSKDAVEKILGIVGSVLISAILIITGILSGGMKWGLKQLGAHIPKLDEDAEPSALGTILSKLWQILAPILKQLWRLWQRLLAILRERVFPDALKKLSDVTLTIFAGAIVISIFWLTSTITPDQKSVPVAQVKMGESPQPSTPLTPSKSYKVDPKRLATVQEQVMPVADAYGDDVIQAVQIEKAGSRLSVMLGTDWYRLDAYRQNQLARDLFKRSQSLSFDELELLDFEGNRVARSPVIGSKMIIFERTSETVAELDRLAAEEAAAAAAAAAAAESESVSDEKPPAMIESDEEAPEEPGAAENRSPEPEEPVAPLSNDLSTPM